MTLVIGKFIIGFHFVIHIFYLDCLLGKLLLPFVLFADFLFIVRDAAAPNTPPKTAG
eukprot:gene14155-14519_t